MFHRLALGTLVCAVPLAAQIRVITQRKTKAPTTWAEFLKAAPERGTSLVVLDAQGGAFPGALAEAMGAEPLIAYMLETTTFELQTSMAREALAAQGWDPVPRWILLDVKGRVLFESVQRPTADRVLGALDGAGIRSRVAQLAEFVSAHPDHGEAVEMKLGSELSVAARRMSRLGLWKRETPTPTSTRLKQLPPRSLTRPMTDEEDQRIWGGVASTLEHLILRCDWQGGGVFWASGLNSDARLSARVRQAALRVIPEVEAALARHPTHHMTWELWIRLSDWCGGRPLKPVLGALTPFPEGFRTFPPENVIKSYVARAFERGDWAGIRELLAPHWERSKQTEVLVFGGDDPARAVEFLELQWEETPGPLVEALLRLGDTQAADQVVHEAITLLKGPTLGHLAAALATRCGHPDLATRWAALTPSKGR